MDYSIETAIQMLNFTAHLINQLRKERQSSEVNKELEKACLRVGMSVANYNGQKPPDLLLRK